MLGLGRMRRTFELLGDNCFFRLCLQVITEQAVMSATQTVRSRSTAKATKM